MKLPKNTLSVTFERVPSDGFKRTVGGVTSWGLEVPLQDYTIEELNEQQQKDEIRVIEYTTTKGGNGNG
jgi:hypothetical protein